MTKKKGAKKAAATAAAAALETEKQTAKHTADGNTSFGGTTTSGTAITTKTVKTEINKTIPGGDNEVQRMGQSLAPIQMPQRPPKSNQIQDQRLGKTKSPHKPQMQPQSQPQTQVRIQTQPAQQHQPAKPPLALRGILPRLQDPLERSTQSSLQGRVTGRNPLNEPLGDSLILGGQGADTACSGRRRTNSPGQPHISAGAPNILTSALVGRDPILGRGPSDIALLPPGVQPFSSHTGYQSQRQAPFSHAAHPPGSFSPPTSSCYVNQHHPGLRPPYNVVQTAGMRYPPMRMSGVTTSGMVPSQPHLSGGDFSKHPAPALHHLPEPRLSRSFGPSVRPRSTSLLSAPSRATEGHHPVPVSAPGHQALPFTPYGTAGPSRPRPSGLPHLPLHLSARPFDGHLRPMNNVNHTPNRTRHINVKHAEYLTLSNGSYDHQFVFRVYSDSSISPLIGPASSSTSLPHQPGKPGKRASSMQLTGFFAPSSTFAHLTPAAYGKVFEQKATNGLPAPSVLKGPWMRSTMIDHILSRPQETGRVYSRTDVPLQRPLRGHNGNISSSQIPPAVQTYRPIGREERCWISTCRNFDWAIWDIARRLALANVTGKADKVVHLAVVRSTAASISPTPAGPSNAGTGVPTLPGFPSPASARASSTGGEGGGVPFHVVEQAVSPYSILQAKHDHILSPTKQALSAEAIRRSRECLEVLYWGRIFGENVLEDYDWSADELPFRLPYKFWSRTQQARPALPGWLGRLRWDPRTDNWVTAMRAMREIIQPSTDWEDQPVHLRDPTWPHPSPDNKKIDGQGGQREVKADATSFHLANALSNARKNHLGRDVLGPSGGASDLLRHSAGTSEAVVDLMA